MTIRGTAAGGACLVLSCPAEDVVSAAQVAGAHGAVLLPAGGEGNLAEAIEVETMYIVEITTEGPRPAVTWVAQLGTSVALSSPEPAELLPPTWMQRHPDAYERARQGSAELTSAPDDRWDDDDDPPGVQVFIPVSDLRQLSQDEWLFTNELVPKQQRRGRTFSPRVPTLVLLPER